MTLKDLVQNILGFDSWNHSEKIKFLGWYIHTYRNQERFNQADIKACYEELHLALPSSISPFLDGFVKNNRKEMLRDRQGFRLAKNLRDGFDNRYGKRTTAIQVDRLLSDLPDKIPNSEQREFLNEAIVCFKYGAFRAAIVMCWNLSFDHLCDYVIFNHCVDFNQQLPKSYKNRTKPINKKEDFEELKEFEILQVCRSAGITTNGVHKILSQKLETRNSAAHPSNVSFNQLQAEEFISTLINNVVLKFNIG